MLLPDLTGRRAVVTGANAGLGLASARALAHAGAEVVLAVRDVTKGELAAAKIKSAYPGAWLRVSELDLADLSSVRRFARSCAEEGPLDILMNNAGLMRVPTRQLTTDGFEMHMGVNHLGHFALTAQLLPALTQAQSPRVVSLSSVAHRIAGPLDPGLGLGGRYNAMTAYAQSKLACALFGFELDRRLRQAGSTVTSVVAHPGLSATELFTRQQQPGLTDRLVGLVTPIVATRPATGAEAQLRAAVDPSLRGGELIGPRFLVRGRPVREPPGLNARDPRSAGWLWEQSEQLTDQSFAVVAG